MRNYEHTPRPETEYHPHIRNLIERQERKSKDKIRHQDREKMLAERQEEIDKAKEWDVIEFYCPLCKEDFAHFATKQVEQDWSNSSQKIAFYKGKHDCGTWTIRHITDKVADPYWIESPQVARDIGSHALDLIQPHQTGFNLLYGRKNNHRKS